MAKSKGKKKSKSKKSKGGSASIVAGTSSADVVAGDTQPIWSTAEECAHYAALGCHIANIARCRPASKSNSRHNNMPKHNSTKTSMPSYTCSEYEEMYDRSMQQYPWILGIERFDPSEYHPEDIKNIPEVAMNDGDDEDGQMILTLTNVTKDTTNICFVTVYDVNVCDTYGSILKNGVASVTTSAVNSTDDKDQNSTIKERKCTTFIVLCPPQTFVHLCSLAPNQTIQSPSSTEITSITSWSQIEIESDVQPWSFHPNTDDEHPYLLHFPFYGINKEVPERDAPSYQCTQSEDGQLTHFFHGNYHAIDFACPIGTPLYSPANGTVVDVKDTVEGDEKCNSSGVREVSGIASRNLFHWNSVMIQVDVESAPSKDESADPLFIEFVHIQTNSCEVKVGDVVQKGQLLCRSGSVGFSPEPHLHLAAYRSNGNDAATVRVKFETYHIDSDEISSGKDAQGVAADRERSFLPRTGGWYNQSGLV
ncbi:hypothetical protein ACHAXR_006992 [Thalassiosira sp. AJA248-18]